MDYAAMINRVIRAAMLDATVYEEVEHDTRLTQEALKVVILVSLAAGVGGFLSTLFEFNFFGAIGNLIFNIITGILGYYIWAYLTHWIGTNVFKGTANVDELLRTLGYASGPRALAILSFVPCLGNLIALVGALWSLATSVIAVRQALDFDTNKAIITVVIGWVVVLILWAVINPLTSYLVFSSFG